MKPSNIGGLIRAEILLGRSNEEILASVLAQFPAAKTTVESIRWYRSDMKRKGDKRTKQLARGKTPADLGIAAAKAEDEARSQASLSEYSLSNVKTWQSPDGGGFTATLLRGTKRIAELYDAGTGGAIQFDWSDSALPKVEVNGYDYKDEPVTYRGTPEQKRLVELVQQTYVDPTFNDKPFRKTPDIFVGDDLLNGHLERRRFKRLYNAKLLIAVEGKGVVYWDRKKLTPKAEAACRAKHPTGVVLNDLPFDEAFPLFMRHANKVQ